jgi:uncharacterized protein (TIGR02594 family)
MLTRRGFVRGVGLGTMVFALNWRSSVGQSSSLPPGIGVDPDCTSPLPPIGELGTSPALRVEQETAQAVLGECPAGPHPVSVAEFFLEVSTGKYGTEWQPYAQGWPVRWNPLIVTFFRATATTPEGDVTPWCAAFVNWCFQQAGKGLATHSASSGKFRSFGIRTTTPIPGDIVVFRRTNAAQAAKGRGHVGFFVAEHADSVEVLGGNQIEGHERCHMISSQSIPKRGAVLTLDSFRTDPRLH